MNTSDARLVVFESGIRENFYPLTYTKLASDLFFGTCTILEGIERRLSTKCTDIYAPKYLEAFAKEVHPSVVVNDHNSSTCIIVSSLVSHRDEFWGFALNAIEEPGQVIYMDHLGNLVFGKLDESSPSLLEKNLRKHSTIKKIILPAEISNIALIKYPWELVKENPGKIASDFSYPSRFQLKSTDIEVRGSKVSIAENADVERFVTFDSRKGPIIIDEEAEVESFSHLTGPCFVGKWTKVRSARLREGTSIASGCKVAGEIDASIVSERTNKSHDGYLGHSVVGSWVNLGAMTTNSDLKNTYGKISVKMGRKPIDTGEIKVGVFLGDMSKTAIGSLLSSGRKVGVGSQVFGIVSEDVPSFTMYGKSLAARSAEIYIESVLSTQKRMMERRGLHMTDAMASLIRSIYKMTKGERAFQRVAKTRFKLP